MSLRKLIFGTLCALWVVGTVAAGAQVLVLGSTVRQSGATGVPNRPMDLTLRPFTFSGTPYNELGDIDALRITLSIWNGGTDQGEAGFNQLGFFIGDIDTGIRLNGFTSGKTVRQTIQARPNNSAQILASLNGKGEARGNVRSLSSFGNTIGLSNSTVSRLELIGARGAVPEPGAGELATGLCGGALAIGWAVRRRMSARRR